MKILVIFLSSLLSGISPTGLIIDSIVADNIRSRVSQVEQLVVRVDNTPSHQLLQGKINRVRIASRGLYPIENLRLQVLELETDPIDLNLKGFRQSDGKSPLDFLNRPLQGGVRLVVLQQDLNNALQTPNIQTRLRQLLNQVLPEREDRKFNVVEIRLFFLGNNRLGGEFAIVQTDLPTQETKSLQMRLEADFKVIGGRSLQILEPSGWLNGRKLSTRLLKGFAEGLSEELDLRKLDERGILVRVLELNITEEVLNLTLFFRLERNPASAGS
jgi:hypothetical protein